jgi:hypothetical protein
MLKLAPFICCGCGVERLAGIAKEVENLKTGHKMGHKTDSDTHRLSGAFAMGLLAKHQVRFKVCMLSPPRDLHQLAADSRHAAGTGRRIPASVGIVHWTNEKGLAESVIAMTVPNTPSSNGFQRASRVRIHSRPKEQQI